MRQRRNKATTRSTLAPSAERTRRTRRTPRLPKIFGEDGKEQPWHMQTRAWWHDVWASPMAKEFLEPDVHGLLRLAVLVNAFWHKPSRELAGEIRLQEQRYGLNPMARRGLQWQVESVREKRRPRPRTTESDEPQAPADDPRRNLRVVS